MRISAIICIFPWAFYSFWLILLFAFWLILFTNTFFHKFLSKATFISYIFSKITRKLSKKNIFSLFKVNKFLKILLNVIQLNKFPFKGGLNYFFLLLTGIICSIIIRLNLLVKLTVVIPNELLILIKIVSCVYACFLFFNFIIISKHAYNLIDYFNKSILNLQVNVKGKWTSKDLSIIRISYYVYYFYITLVTSWIVCLNYISVLEIQNLNLDFIVINFNYLYLFCLFLSLSLAIYFLFIKKVDETYNLNKKINWLLKLGIFAIVAFYLSYLYCLYFGILNIYLNRFLDLEFFESCESNGKEKLVGLVEKTVKSNNTNSNIVKDTISINDTSNSSLVNNVQTTTKLEARDQVSIRVPESQNRNLNNELPDPVKQVNDLPKKNDKKDNLLWTKLYLKKLTQPTPNTTPNTTTNTTTIKVSTETEDLKLTTSTNSNLNKWIYDPGLAIPNLTKINTSSTANLINFPTTKINFFQTPIYSNELLNLPIDYLYIWAYFPNDCLYGSVSSFLEQNILFKDWQFSQTDDKFLYSILSDFLSLSFSGCLKNLTTSLKYDIIDKFHYYKYLNLLKDISMQQDSINLHLKNLKPSINFYKHFEDENTNLIYLNGSYSYLNFKSKEEQVIVQISNVYNLYEFFKQVYLTKYDCEASLINLENNLKLRNNKILSISEDVNKKKWIKNLSDMNKIINIFTTLPEYKDYLFSNDLITQDLVKDLRIKNLVFKKYGYSPAFQKPDNLRNYFIYIPEEKCFMHITPNNRIINKCDSVLKLRCLIKNLNKESLTTLKSICTLYELEFRSLDNKDRWLDIKHIDTLFSKFNIFTKNFSKKDTLYILKKLKLIKNNFETIILMKEALGKPILGIDKMDKMEPYFTQKINCPLSINGGPNSPKLIDYTDIDIIDELDEDPFYLEK